MLDLDLMVASAATVVAIGRMLVEMTESLPADFVSVVTTSELTEKEAAEVAVGQEDETAVDL
jgi:hypothetical protein